MSRLDRAFSLACGKARESADWLAVLKRARAAEAAGDTGRYTAIADRARKAFPESEPIAAAAALAYVRGGRPADALSLFGGPISPDARPDLWAEAFLAARGTGAREPARTADYVRLAGIIGEARPYLGAAALALAAGDPNSARAWLEKGIAGGAQAPPELLWDCGLYEVLAARPDLGSGAGELALMGDAAWRTGDSSLARRRWQRAIALDPKFSWKPYVDLALMEGDKGEAADSYWARLKAAFLSGPPSAARDGALAAFSAHLARTDRDEEALRALKGGEGSGAIAALTLFIEGRNEPEARYAADLERLVASRAGDPEVQGAALRELAIRGMYGEVALLREGAARRGLQIAYGWYYDAAVRAARGDYKGAAATIESSVAGGGETDRGPGLAASYALGRLYGAMGDPVKAAAAFSRAVSAARGAGERCSALKALGNALGDSGDSAGAAEAYRAASEADPSDPEAAILSRSGSGK
jgi:tetratricopeptide (TPR) repeat protein